MAGGNKLEISRYLPESTTLGNFNLRRTLSGLFFVIPEHLVLESWHGALLSVERGLMVLDVPGL